MASSVSRRELMALAASAAPGVGQVNVPPTPGTPQQLLQAARQDREQASTELRRTKVAQLLEPSFSFRPY